VGVGVRAARGVGMDTRAARGAVVDVGAARGAVVDAGAMCGLGWGVGAMPLAWRQSPRYLQQKKGRVEQWLEPHDWARRGSPSRRDEILTSVPLMIRRVPKEDTDRNGASLWGAVAEVFE
jgi:hypothetical protein